MSIFFILLSAAGVVISLILYYFGFDIFGHLLFSIVMALWGIYFLVSERLGNEKKNKL